MKESFCFRGKCFYLQL